jgi:Ran GTPase-activating protein (RanGAP) involved in mRNA processing and transport
MNENGTKNTVTQNHFLMEELIRRLYQNDETLLELYLRWNNIGDDGASKLADALKVNTTLLELDLRWNKIGPDGASKLADALKVNTTLLKLDLWKNNIGNKNKKKINDQIKINICIKENYILLWFEELSKILPNELSIKILSYLVPIENAEQVLYEKISHCSFRHHKRIKIC